MKEKKMTEAETIALIVHHAEKLRPGMSIGAPSLKDWIYHANRITQLLKSLPRKSNYFVP